MRIPIFKFFKELTYKVIGYVQTVQQVQVGGELFEWNWSLAGWVLTANQVLVEDKPYLTCQKQWDYWGQTPWADRRGLGTCSLLTTDGRWGTRHFPKLPAGLWLTWRPALPSPAKKTAYRKSETPATGESQKARRNKRKPKTLAQPQSLGRAR